MFINFFNKLSNVASFSYFIVICFTCYYVTFSSINNQLVLNLNNLQLFLSSSTPVVVFTLVCIFFSYISKRSLFKLSVVWSVIFITFSLFDLVPNFEQSVIFFTIAVVVLSCLFLIIAQIDSSQACYNPNYSSNNLFEPGFSKLTVYKEDDKFIGNLINWDASSAFIFLDKSSSAIISGRLDLIIKFNNQVFNETATVSFRNRFGVGVIFERSESARDFCWSELYTIIKNQGLSPKDVI